jgi:hypothetical protein
MTMTVVTNTIRIRGQADAVFDLMTTARFWPQWHPATVAVGGVVERPFQLGSIVHEQAQIGQHRRKGNWTVAEHHRPHHVLLRMEGDRLRIRYDFAAEGDNILLTRQLEFHPEDFAASLANPALLAPLMQSQSAEALAKLKALIERILQTESELTPSVTRATTTQGDR